MFILELFTLTDVLVLVLKIGMGYRLKDAMNFSVGMIYANVGVGYSYDFTTSGNLLGKTLHEINLTYYLPNIKYDQGYKKGA